MPNALEQLKREAKRYKKANPGTKHHEALDHVARAKGYRDYRHARAELTPDNDESEDV